MTARDDRAALRRQVMSGLRWSAAAYYANMAIRLAISVSLARLLAPDQFGVMALAMVLVGALGLFQDSGLSSALVQYRGRIDAAATTVVLATTTAGLALGAILWLAAPYAAAWFEQPALVDVVRALAVVLVIRGWGGAPRALLQRDMRFRTLATVECIGTVVYGATGIVLAREGFGAWSLVLAQIAAETWNAAAWWSCRPVVPTRASFDWAIARDLGAFGRHMVAANILGVVQVQLPTVVVGALLGPFSLGLYEMALRWAWMPVKGITHVTARVAYPTFVRLRDDHAALGAAYRRVLQGVLMLALPSTVGLALVASPLIATLYDDRWTGAVAPLRALAFCGLLHAIAASTGEVFKAIGRPGWVGLYAVVYDVILAIALWVLGVHAGLVGVALATVLAPGVVAIASVATVGRVLGVPLRSFAALAAGPLVATAVMSAAVLAAGALAERLDAPAWAALAWQTVAGVAVYAAAARRLEPAWWREMLASAGFGARDVDLPAGSVEAAR